MRASSAITKLLDVENPRKIEDRVFVIVHVESYARLSKTVYMPAEIGLSSFSVSSGILDNYATLIDPGNLKLGNEV
jgi:hypothetical protein